MKIHTPTVTPALALVSDERPRAVRSDLDTRALVARLCAEGFERVPAPLVARRMSRGRSVVYTWGKPEGTSPRLADVLAAPAAFARIVLAGALAAVQQPRCGAPSRWEIARVISAVMGTLATIPDRPEEMTDAQIDEALGQLDDLTAKVLSKAEQLQQEKARRRERRAR